MRLPRCLRSRRKQATPVRSAPSEATIARIQAEVALEITKAQTPRYRALGDSLRELRERNHLAQSFEAAFQKGRSA